MMPRLILFNTENRVIDKEGQIRRLPDLRFLIHWSQSTGIDPKAFLIEHRRRTYLALSKPDKVIASRFRFPRFL